MGNAGTLAAGIASWAGHNSGVTDIIGKVPASLQYRGFEEHQTPFLCLNCGHHATLGAAITVVTLSVFVAQEKENMVKKILLKQLSPKGTHPGSESACLEQGTTGYAAAALPLYTGMSQHREEMKDQDMS